MRDCKGKKLKIGDFFKYRSIFSMRNSRASKQYIGKILRSDDKGIVLTLLRGKFERNNKIEIEVELNVEMCERGAVEKLTNEEAMLWKLENAI